MGIAKEGRLAHSLQTPWYRLEMWPMFYKEDPSEFEIEMSSSIGYNKFT